MTREIPKLPEKGVSYDATCPATYADAFTQYPFVFKAEDYGETFSIPDLDGNYVASFDRRRAIQTNGYFMMSGSADLFGQKVTLRFHRSYDTGKSELMVYLKHVYFDPLIYKTQEEIEELFRQRACYVAGILNLHRWKITDDEPKMIGHISIRAKAIPSDIFKASDVAAPAPEVQSACSEPPATKIEVEHRVTVRIGETNLSLSLDEARELKDVLQHILPAENAGDVKEGC